MTRRAPSSVAVASTMAMAATSLMLVLLSLVVSPTMAEVLTFCPVGENAMQAPACEEAYAWVTTTMLPLCLATGRVRRRQKVYDLQFYDIMEVIHEEAQLHDTVERDYFRRLVEEAIKEQEHQEQQEEAQDLEEEEVDGFQVDVVGQERRLITSGCSTCRVEACRTWNPPAACCVYCNNCCTTTNGGRRRRMQNGSTSTFTSMSSTKVTPTTASASTRKVQEAADNSEWLTYGDEAKLTIEKYLKYVDGMCSTMFQLQGKETGCFGDDPSQLRCTSYMLF